MNRQIVRALLLFSLLLAVSEGFLLFMGKFSPVVFGYISAVVACVYSFSLIKEGMIFDFIPKYVYLISEKLAKGNVNKANRLRWTFKFLTDCEKCFAGQFALWLYPLLTIPQGLYSILLHIYSIALAITLTHIISYVWKAPIK